MRNAEALQNHEPTLESQTHVTLLSLLLGVKLTTPHSYCVEMKGHILLRRIFSKMFMYRISLDNALLKMREYVFRISDLW